MSGFMSLTARNRRTTLSRMNKLCILPTFVISLLLLALTPGLRAQTAQGIENAEKVAQELKLTPQQEAKVLPILKQEAPKIEEIKNNQSLSGIQKMRQLRAIHSETAPELQKILSPEQYQKLQAIREERIKDAMAKKRAGG
jgi:Spy/CpxP family protein refolding chaperone